MNRRFVLVVVLVSGFSSRTSTSRFMVPKHVSEVVAALHEPRGAAGTFGGGVSPGSIYGGGETAGPEPPTPMFTPTGLILREAAREPSLMATVWTNVLTIRSAYLTSV